MSPSRATPASETTPLLRGQGHNSSSSSSNNNINDTTARNGNDNNDSEGQGASEHDASDPETQSGAAISTLPASSHFPKPIRNLTYTVFIMSLFSLALFLAAYILIQCSDFNYSAYRISQTYGPLTFFLLLALVFSISNLLLGPCRVPHIINVLLDIFISYWLLYALVFVIDRSALPVPPESWCSHNSYYPPDDDNVVEPPAKTCVVAAKVVLVLFAVLGAGVGIIGLSHLILFILRIIAAFRTRFWQRRRFTGLRIPTGQFSIEIVFRSFGREDLLVVREGDGAVSNQGTEPRYPRTDRTGNGVRASSDVNEGEGGERSSD